MKKIRDANIYETGLSRRNFIKTGGRAAMAGAVLSLASGKPFGSEDKTADGPVIKSYRALGKNERALDTYRQALALADEELAESIREKIGHLERLVPTADRSTT